jgi:hypothetical protein
MAVSKELSRFTRDALVAGRSREEIAQALGASGWSGPEVKDALNAWSETPFSPPIPKPQSTVSARDFFFYTLTFGLMAFGAGFLIQIFFVLIERMMGEELYGYAGDLRSSISVLIVVVPLFLWLTVRDQRALAADPAQYRSAIRRWLTYLALLVTSVILLADLIVVINALLMGALTLTFLLKAGIVAIVTGLIFGYYLGDIRKGDTA